MTTQLSVSKRLVWHAGLVLALLTTLCQPIVVGATSPAAPADTVLISEILPNAVNESTGELFEIVNIGPVAVDLSTWKFADASGVQQGLVAFTKPLPFGTTGTTLQSGQVGIVLDKDYASEYDTEILLSDSSNSVVLLTTSTGNLSLANSADGVVLLDETGTTIDSFAWSSDPGSEITFARQLEVGGLTALSASSSRSLGWVETLEIPEPITKPSVELSELFPNPASGEEFIELHTSGATEVDLDGLSLRDASGKIAPLSGLLPSGGFIALYKSTTAIALNNDGDMIELLWAGGDGSVLDTATYESSGVDESWSRIDGAFVWTTEATPGEVNVLIQPTTPEPEPSDTDEEEDEEQEETIDTDVAEDVIEIASLGELQSLSGNSEVRVTGVVASPLGLFYKNTLHLADTTGAALVQLEAGRYPIGTRLTVTGTTQLYAKQIRITASDAQAEGEAKVPYTQVTPGELEEEQVGLPVEMKGTVVSTSAKSFRLGNKTNNTLISIRKNTGISQKAPKKGSTVSVRGIVLRSGEQLVLAPRSTADLSAATKSTETQLAETGSGLATLVQVCVGAALALSGAWLAVRQALCRAESSGRSGSSRGHAVQ